HPIQNLFQPSLVLDM
nr:RecName: Full=Retinol-binding protein 3; AltName: Full=Interphotoreceptor retinoid-binding protein; Short=IRBP; AltName: Full=Interstitial retinol-binding protein [Cricetinae gen. sp.]